MSLLATLPNRLKCLLLYVALFLLIVLIPTVSDRFASLVSILLEKGYCNVVLLCFVVLQVKARKITVTDSPSPPHVFAELTKSINICPANFHQ